MDSRKDQHQSDEEHQVLMGPLPQSKSGGSRAKPWDKTTLKLEKEDIVWPKKRGRKPKWYHLQMAQALAQQKLQRQQQRHDVLEPVMDSVEMRSFPSTSYRDNIFSPPPPLDVVKIEQQEPIPDWVDVKLEARSPIDEGEMGFDAQWHQEQQQEQHEQDIKSSFEIRNRSIDGRVSINFRSATKPEIYFCFDGSGGDDDDVSMLETINKSRIRKEMLKTLEQYQAQWSVALKNFEVGQEFTDSLVNFHMGFNTVTKSLLKVHFVALAKLFADFALLQPEFTALSTADQRILLCRNTPLFIQYLVARYFHASTGMEQLQWMVASKLSPQPVSYKDDVFTVSPHRFNEAVKIFAKDASLESYERFGKFITENSVFDFRCNSLVAMACLYSTSFVTFIDQPSVVEDHLCNFYNFANWSNEVYGLPGQTDLKRMVLHLEELGLFFDTNVIWTEADSLHSLLKLPVISYTGEEEKWLQKKFDDFHRNFCQVSLGEDIVREFVMFTYDVPLSKSFMPKALSTFAERFRSILRGHEEFQLMSSMVQATSLRDCAFHSLAIYVAQIETSNSGNDQLRLSCGYLDDELFTKKFYPVINTSRLKKMSMGDANDSGELMPPELMKRFFSLIQSLSSLVEDNETFKLIVLIIMFDGNESMSHIRNKYELLLQRRLQHSGGEGNDTFATLMSGKNKIKELSQVLQMIVQQGMPEKKTEKQESSLQHGESASITEMQEDTEEDYCSKVVHG